MKQEPLNRLTVMVTDDCNLNCKGCVTDAQNGKQGKRTINPFFVQKVFHEYGENFRDRQTGLLYLFFSGRGEPTLRMDVIEEIHKTAREIFSLENLYVGLQTNGVFDDKNARRISEISDVVWMSVDGAPQENDKIRKYGTLLQASIGKGGSSEQITRNTRTLQENGIDVRWRSTIHETNVNKQRELIDYALSLDIKTIVAEPAIISPSVSQNGLLYLVSPGKFIDRFIDANNHAKQLGISYTTGLMEEARKIADPCARRCKECFAIDIERTLPKSATLTTDNRMVGCYLGYEDNLKMKSLTFGRMEGNNLVIDYDKLEQLTKAYREQKGCHGRELTGRAEVSQELLKRLFNESKFPENNWNHP